MSTFYCCYCEKDHAVDKRAREHIIPECLKSPSYTLNDTCKFWNNFFARTFEGNITQSTFIDLILDSYGFVKSKGKQYLGQVTTKRGTIEHRWRIDGKEVLRDLPIFEYTDTIVANIPLEDGTIATRQIKLPFEVPKEVRGSSDLTGNKAAQFSREFEAIQPKIAQYIADVYSDRSLDPDLHDFLTALGGEKKPNIDASINETVKPAHSVSDVDDLLIPVDLECLRQFYIKIAWCHACKHLGPQALRSLSKWDLMRYLQSGIIPTEVADQCRAVDAATTDAILKEDIIDLQSVWHWKFGIDETRKILANASPEICWILGDHFGERLEQNAIAQKRVEFYHDVLLIGDAGRPRQHKLRISIQSKNSMEALLCEVSLFGGLWKALVRLSDWQEPGKSFPTLPDEKVISF